MTANADVQSANIVGYSQPSTTSQSVSWTPMFTPVEGFKATYQLKDFKAKGMMDWGDSIQFLDPDSASTILQVVYLDAETYGEDMAGWWQADGDFMSEEYKKDSTPVPAGQGFLAAFMSGEEISITFPAAYTK